MAKSIMIQGTASNAGKSVVVAGLCRIFSNMGLKVAPFKSQNMALNLYITKEGHKMSRAQAVQAECARIEPHSDMNPILLKPNSDKSSQVIVNGKSIKTMDAKEYFEYKNSLKPVILKAYNNLAENNDIIVIEGAGSPAEINLNQNDIVNMGLAKMIDSPVILVADIDRGGVFASIYGTVKLLSEDDQKRIKGIIINKFRGDVKLLEPGIKMIEELVKIPVIGVIPYFEFNIDDEDSLSEKLNITASKKIIDIAIIKLDKMSNFSDFSIFSMFDDVSLRYVEKAQQIGNPDLIIVPGTENLSDALLKNNQDLFLEIVNKNKNNCPVIGICEGMQIISHALTKNNNECNKTINYLGLLDINMQICKEKIPVKTEGSFDGLTGFFSCINGEKYSGYKMDIKKIYGNNELKSITVQTNKKGNVLGTCLYNFFENDNVAYKIIQSLMNKKGINSNNNRTHEYKEFLNGEYEKIAENLIKSIDMMGIYGIISRRG